MMADLWSTFTDVFTGEPAKNAAAQNAILFNQAQNTGLAYIGRGVRSSEAALGNARRYSPAVTTYLGALGVNGPEGTSAARSAFSASPGYDFTRDEALKAVERSAAGRGMLLSGNTLQALQNRGTQLANQEYSNWLDRLAGFVAPEYNAALASAGGQAGTYTALPSIYTGAANQQVKRARSSSWTRRTPIARPTGRARIAFTCR